MHATGVPTGRPPALLDSRAMLETTVELPAALVPLVGPLKSAGLVDSGGESEHVIQAAQVRGCGAPGTRRGAKIRGGDVVVIEGEAPVRMRITSAENA